MNNLNEIELNIYGNIIKSFIQEKAKTDININYKEVYNHTYKVIRFSTHNLESIFIPNKQKTGIWNNGLKAMYEISYIDGMLSFKCRIDENASISKNLLDQHCLYINYQIEPEQINNMLKSIFEIEFSFYENELIKLKNDRNYKIKPFPSFNTQLFNKEALSFDFFIEGNMIEVVSNKYERNIEAKRKCILHYGCKCQICGFDFEKVYGKEFYGKIHVHHIVPISSIKEEYIIDPINDLIPVCPNCHMVLHSKPNGVYTPQEIIQKIKNTY